MEQYSSLLFSKLSGSSESTYFIVANQMTQNETNGTWQEEVR